MVDLVNLVKVANTEFFFSALAWNGYDYRKPPHTLKKTQLIIEGNSLSTQKVGGFDPNDE